MTCSPSRGNRVFSLSRISQRVFVVDSDSRNHTSADPIDLHPQPKSHVVLVCAYSTANRRGTTRNNVRPAVHPACVARTWCNIIAFGYDTRDGIRGHQLYITTVAGKTGAYPSVEDNSMCRGHDAPRRPGALFGTLITPVFVRTIGVA